MLRTAATTGRKEQPRQGRADKGCAHHWIVEKDADDDGFCRGQCKHCGETRNFAKNVTDREDQAEDWKKNLNLSGAKNTQKVHQKKYWLAVIAQMQADGRTNEEIVVSTELNRTTANSYLNEIKLMEGTHSQFDMTEYLDCRNGGMKRSEIARKMRITSETVAKLARHATLCPFCNQN